MSQPATTGPMRGSWQPAYMADLQRLKDEVNRELDRAQVGDVARIHPAFASALGSVLAFYGMGVRL